jgi:thiol-disulfide isomerase/thioredoxin
MPVSQTPAALLFLAGQCPHCPAVLAALSELVKRGVIGRLEVVNIESHPEAAQALAVRSVPWLRIGPFQLAGARSPAELEIWARRAASEEGVSDAFHDLLKQADLAQVLRLIQADAARLAALLPIVANPEASLNVKLGVGVVFEEYAGQPALQALVAELGGLTQHADARVRADASHLLSLTQSAEARAWLQARLRDDSADVREIAAESLQTLEGLI